MLWTLTYFNKDFNTEKINNNKTINVVIIIQTIEQLHFCFHNLIVNILVKKKVLDERKKK